MSFCSYNFELSTEWRNVSLVLFEAGITVAHFGCPSTRQLRRSIQSETRRLFCFGPSQSPPRRQRLSVCKAGFMAALHSPQNFFGRRDLFEAVNFQPRWQWQPLHCRIVQA